MDIRGQAVTSRDRLYLAASIPMMLVWGERDRVLPVRHARAAADYLPGCHLDVVPGAGHLPHQSDPDHVVAAIRAFLRTTPASAHDADLWRGLLEAGSA